MLSHSVCILQDSAYGCNRQRLRDQSISASNMRRSVDSSAHRHIPGCDSHSRMIPDDVEGGYVQERSSHIKVQSVPAELPLQPERERNHRDTAQNNFVLVPNPHNPAYSHFIMQPLPRNDGYMEMIPAIRSFDHVPGTEGRMERSAFLPCSHMATDHLSGLLVFQRDQSHGGVQRAVTAPNRLESAQIHECCSDPRESPKTSNQDQGSPNTPKISW